MLKITSPIQIDTTARVEIVLTSDESIAGANDEQALRLYMETSDISLLAVPDDATVFVCHPLTRDEIRGCRREAGRQPVSGLFMDTSIGEGQSLAEWGAKIDALSDAEYASWEAMTRWTSRLNAALCRASIVDVRNAPAPLAEMMTWLDGEGDDVVVANELGAHVWAISSLGPVGKARSGSPSGATTSTPAGGAATTADPARTSTDSGDGAGDSSPTT